VALVKQQKVNNPHCFWSNSPKKSQKFTPFRDFPLFGKKNKQISYLDICFASMNWAQNKENPFASQPRAFACTQGDQMSL
jgi:hypothetical protein